MLVLVQTLALIASVYLLREQIKDLENTKSNRSADLIFRFDERLDKPPYSRLRLAIESNKSILKAHGGKFSDDDLEGYLDIWDSLNDVYAKGLISKDMFYNSYSYDLEKAYDNAEVQAYLKEVRKEDPEFYSGFESLAKQMKSARPTPTKTEP